MPDEEWLVDTDVLKRDEPLPPIDLDNAINQEKRVPMRKNPHDLGNSEFVHYFGAGVVAGGFGAAAAGAAGLPAFASMRRMISVVISATSDQWMMLFAWLERSNTTANPFSVE